MKIAVNNNTFEKFLIQQIHLYVYNVFDARETQEDDDENIIISYSQDDVFHLTL